MPRYGVSAFLLRIVGALLLVFVGGAPALQAAVQSHHNMEGGDTPVVANCQSTCNPVTGVMPVSSKREEEDRDETSVAESLAYPVLDLFGFVSIRKFMSVSEWFRLLRPPDILALNSTYRF